MSGKTSLIRGLLCAASAHCPTDYPPLGTLAHLQARSVLNRRPSPLLLLPPLSSPHCLPHPALSAHGPEHCRQDTSSLPGALKPFLLDQGPFQMASQSRYFKPWWWVWPHFCLFSPVWLAVRQESQVPNRCFLMAQCGATPRKIIVNTGNNTVPHDLENRVYLMSELVISGKSRLSVTYDWGI